VDFTEQAESWVEDLPKRINPVPLAKTHGAKLSEQPPFDVRTISIELVVIGTSADDARTNWDNIVNAFPEEIDKLYKHDDRYLNAYFAGVGNQTFEEGSAGIVLRGTLKFFCPDPFYYALTETTSSTAATGTKASRTVTPASGATGALTFTAREIGQFGNNVRVKMVSAGAESIVTATTEISATYTALAANANADLTFTASAVDANSPSTGVDGEKVRIRMVTGTVERIDVRGWDIEITYNAGTSTANSLKTLIDANRHTRHLVSVAVEGTGEGLWVAGDTMASAARMIHGQQRDITVNYDGVAPDQSTADSLKTRVEADATANSWISVTSGGAGVWAPGDNESDFSYLTSGAPHTISPSNSGGTTIFPRITFTPVGGNVSTLAMLAAANFPGRTFHFKATVSSGNKLILDTPSFDITNNGVSSLSDWLPSAAQGGGTASDVIWFETGTNSLELEWTLPTTSAATSITVDLAYTTRWI